LFEAKGFLLYADKYAILFSDEFWGEVLVVFKFVSVDFFQINWNFFDLLDTYSLSEYPLFRKQQKNPFGQRNIGIRCDELVFFWL